MRTRLIAASCTFVLFAVCAVPLAASSSSPVVFVTNSNNAGPGSFRDAVHAASLYPTISRIQFLPRVTTIVLTSTVYFTGTQNLTIDGARATLDAASAGGDAFVVSGGGDLAIQNLTIRNAEQEGLEVQVPTWSTGVLRVSLVNVDILDNDGHGVLVNDQADPLDAANANGSDASVDVSVFASRFLRNGFSVSDRDGLRVNEGGPGALRITVWLSTAAGNGADGIEADERGDGDVVLNMFGSQVNQNGIFDPADFDDGFDIDEAGDGSIVGKVVLSSANDNYEEGFDFNENHAGDLRVDMVLVEASRNAEEGIDYEEDDDFAGGGDLVTVMTGIRAHGNQAGDAGLKIREKGVGELDVTVTGLEASGNSTSGVQIREDAEGSLRATISRAQTLANGGHGIDFDENRATATDAGNLTAEVVNATSAHNTGAGVRADQQTPGTGALQLTNVTLSGNTGGDTTGGGVTVTVTP